jgi:hypothetical protein
MANLIRTQYVQDTNKRLLAKVVIISDGSQQANTTLIDASTLRFAMNANSYIMTANADPKSVYRTTIKRIFATSKATGTIRLQWQGDANSEIIAFGGSTTFDLNFENMGDTAVLTNPEANATGDILITTTALAAGDVATIILDIKKDGRDYDQGQTADPYAFNNTRPGAR